MGQHVRSAALALVPALAIAMAGSPARAAFQSTVTTTVTPQAGGLNLFTYTVSVPTTSTSSLSEFDLNITNGAFNGIFTPPGATLTSITMPTGFINLYTPGDPTISFFSTDPSTDLKPGGAGGIFSFTSASSAVSQAYQLVDPTGLMTAGTALAPVPEPASLVLLGVGGLGALALHARRRRDRSS